MLARVILANLPQLNDPFESGSIVTFEPARVRVRALPMGKLTKNEQSIRRQRPYFARARHEPGPESGHTTSARP